MKKLIDVPFDVETISYSNGNGTFTNVKVADLPEGAEKKYVVTDGNNLYVNRFNGSFVIDDEFTRPESVLDNREAHYVIGKLDEFGFVLEDADTYGD